jgi:hypothetical protein
LVLRRGKGVTEGAEEKEGNGRRRGRGGREGSGRRRKRSGRLRLKTYFSASIGGDHVRSAAVSFSGTATMFCGAPVGTDSGVLMVTEMLASWHFSELTVTVQLYSTSGERE